MRQELYAMKRDDTRNTNHEIIKGLKRISVK